MRIIKAETEMIDRIVLFHEKNFSGYFLTNLGNSTLKRYYSHFILDEDCIFYLAMMDGEIVGLSLFIDDYSKQINDFYRKNLIFMVFNTTYKILSNKTIREGFSSRIGGIVKRNKKNQDNIKLKYKYTLLSLVTDVDVRGKGIASALLSVGEKELVKKTVGYYLSVLKENDNAIKFYEKKNFYICGEDKNLKYFEKELVQGP